MHPLRDAKLHAKHTMCFSLPTTDDTAFFMFAAPSLTIAVIFFGSRLKSEIIANYESAIYSAVMILVKMKNTQAPAFQPSIVRFIMNRNS